MVGHKYGVLRWSKTGSKYFLYHDFFFRGASIAWFECVAFSLTRENSWRYCSWYNICASCLLFTPSTLRVNWIHSHSGPLSLLSLSLLVSVCICVRGMGRVWVSVEVSKLTSNEIDDISKELDLHAKLIGRSFWLRLFILDNLKISQFCSLDLLSHLK